MRTYCPTHNVLAYPMLLVLPKYEAGRPLANKHPASIYIYR